MKLLTLAAIVSATLATSAYVYAEGNKNAVYNPAENVVAQKLNQVDGYYRFMLGDFEVTALYDGYLEIGSQVYQPFTKLSAGELNKLLDDEFRPRTKSGAVNTAVSAYLINTGKHLILMDAGSGDVFNDKVGKVEESLRKSGYSPEQVDIILPTHLHFDHFSGVTRNGKAIYPNATVYIAEQEKAFWFDTAITDMPKHVQKYAQWTRDAVAPYAAENRVNYYSSGEEVIPGVKTVETPGHTPGHGGFEFSSKDQTMFVWGDLLHNHAFQLVDPSIAAEFDVDPKAARASRVKALAEIAKRKIWVAGAHLPFPGIGHIRAEKDGYSWIPVEYTPIEK
ncbi:MBL fold metallo-hydrolase [Tolumonas osonensis]|uniref:Glyoxylase-like metal-dependent hydrolase (Beta-lactamase superfamily II) n=1 Tax=Tolumonas osonensis TaxID=675874 RepID=A0A841GP29_9GAMM|nr:MBL fold metallo-hydrolase [Tolumonas osonensis]MBB6056222.1 glyoxylase-like metal-dependent hydrolase (beta-lactamase superfamily II) [Tolumonas osonensis]